MMPFCNNLHQVYLHIIKKLEFKIIELSLGASEPKDPHMIVTLLIGNVMLNKN